jgi:hypothetical protein
LGLNKPLRIIPLINPPNAHLSVQVAGFSPVNAIFQVFQPFLSWKELISRRLHVFARKFYFGSHEEFQSQDETEKSEAK